MVVARATVAARSASGRVQAPSPQGSKQGEKAVARPFVADAVRAAVAAPSTKPAVPAEAGAEVAPQGAADAVAVAARTGRGQAARLRRAPVAGALRVPAGVGAGAAPLVARAVVPARRPGPARAPRVRVGEVGVVAGGREVVAVAPVLAVRSVPGAPALTTRPPRAAEATINARRRAGVEPPLPPFGGRRVSQARVVDRGCYSPYLTGLES